MNDTLTIGGEEIAAGQRKIIELPLPPLSTHTELAMPIHVLRGKKPGPTLLVCAALHGDEINGIEIIRRLIAHKSVNRLHGTLVAIPIVNVYGFIHRSRYLPDRRDMNRSFPGFEKGSLAGRLAHLFMTEIVSRCDYGIDLHTAAGHRENLAQVRASLEHEQSRRIAEAFQAPLLIDAPLRAGTVREAALAQGIPWLVYEAGEALRFHEVSIRAGVRGIINVMREIGMLPKSKRQAAFVPRTVRSNAWVRAPQSGILRLILPLGALVSKGAVMGYLADPYGGNEVQIAAPNDGIIIGRTNLPLVYEGDALVHIARFRDMDSAAETVGVFQSELEPDPEGGGDEDAII